jgi:uncharacterized protein
MVLIQMIFDGFDWNEGNLEKCSKHGVTRDEIEAVFLNTPRITPDFAHSQLEDRMIAIGNSITTNKPIFVAFTLREENGETLVRPISARPMHAKEIARYER